MKRLFVKLLLAAAIIGNAASARGLTILPTFDISILTNADAAAITNDILFSIGTFQSNLTDNVTVKILFVADETVGLGQSATWGAPYSYGDYLTALRSRATSVNDMVALSRIPNTPTDPLIGNSQIEMKLPLARMMGLDSDYGPDGFDSTISCKMSLMNFSRPPGDPDKYDFIATVEHEMNEVLGFPSNLKRGYPSGPIGPIDLFRYTTNLVRTWTTNGDDAYFSIDGTNLLARFNQNPDGDYHDWWSYSGSWAPPGQTPLPQVQDAFGSTGNYQDEGPNELAGLDVIGYTLATLPPSAPPLLRFVRNGPGQFTLSWSNIYSGYILQERTNLTTAVWTASASGPTNPAVLAIGGGQKFYRLYKSVGPFVARSAAMPTDSKAAAISSNPNLRLEVHVVQPR